MTDGAVHGPFGAPGAKRAGGGLRPSDLEGEAVVLEVIGFGERITAFSEGESKAYAEVNVRPVTGPHKGEAVKSLWFGAYLVNDLEGYGPGELVFAKVRKGPPRPGLRAGWYLEPITDAQLEAQAEALIG